MENTATRLKLRDVIADAGYDDLMDAAEEWMSEGVVPALCSEHCQVEPDGTCPHGFPSALMAMRVM